MNRTEIQAESSWYDLQQIVKNVKEYPINVSSGIDIQIVEVEYRIKQSNVMLHIFRAERIL